MAKTDLEEVDQTEYTNSPELQSEVDNLVKAVTDLVSEKGNESNHAHVKGELIKDSEPTCTADGTGHYKCKYCGIEIEDAKIPALGHTFVNEVAGKEATCEAAGNYAYKSCSTCNKFFAAAEELYSKNGEDDTTSFIIEALGHDKVAHKAQAPTCTEIGWDAYETCSRCDYTTYEEIPAKDHDYEGKVTTEPTCTEKGVKTYICKNDASHTYTEDIDALNHIDENNDGYCDRTNCKELICDHVGQERKVTDKKEATCLEGGYTGDIRCKSVM
jgi:hypothetical protein